MRQCGIGEDIVVILGIDVCDEDDDAVDETRRRRRFWRLDALVGAEDEERDADSDAEGEEEKDADDADLDGVISVRSPPISKQHLIIRCCSIKKSRKSWKEVAFPSCFDSTKNSHHSSTANGTFSVKIRLYSDGRLKLSSLSVSRAR